jgi:hypothetical protein
LQCGFAGERGLDLPDCYDGLAGVKPVASGGFKTRADEGVGDDDVELLADVPFGIKNETRRDIEARRDLGAKKPPYDLFSPRPEFAGMLDHALHDVSAHPFPGAREHFLETEVLHKSSLSLLLLAPEVAALT